MVFESHSSDETFEFAYNLSLSCKASDIFCLTGDLGVGKTVFVKGFAKGLGIEEDITSPTFSILNIYKGKLDLFHFDVYRINNIFEMEDTGYEDYFYGQGVCLIEWADIIEDLIPDSAVWINITKDYNKNDDYRKISIKKR